MSRRDTFLQVAETVPFDNDNLDWTTSDNVQEAIIDAYEAAKGIRTFPLDLHYVSGTGLNTSMSNGTIFRVRPGTFNSMSFSGYPAAFPLQMPFNCRLYSIVMTFREASFDWNSSGGQILWELETQKMTYNQSSVANRILVRLGNYGTGFGGSGNSTGTNTWTAELFFNNSGGDGFEYISGDPELSYGDLIGCRFVKAPSGDRRVNSWRDIVLKLNFEEVK